MDARTKCASAVIWLGVGGCALDVAPEDPAELEPDLAQQEQAVQEGWLDSGDPAVGIVLSDGAFCTGTLISPSIVLTAAHCLQSGAVHSFYTGNGTPWEYVWPSPDMTRHAVDAQAVHPGYRPGGNPEDGTLGHDIGLLHLATPICSIKPWAIKTSAPESGSTCVAIGFGRHTEGGVTTYSAKRACTEQLTGVFTDVLTLAPLTGRTDGGDSGGPIACDWGGIAGVVGSHKVYSPSSLFAGRVDTAASWIQSKMTEMTRPLERLACAKLAPCRYCDILRARFDLLE